MEYNLAPKGIARFILLNFLLAIIICFFLCASCFTSWNGILSIADDMLYSFLISASMSWGISSIIGLSDKLLPWVKAPVKRAVFDLVVVTSYSFVVSFILVTIFSVYVWKYITWAEFNFWSLAPYTLLPTGIALFITLLLTSRAFLLEWRRSSLETERMRNERLKVQYQSLKDQLNPHFLFNSLNVLSNLVYEDPDRANQFIEKLARVYRYVLEVQHEELVLLDCEIEFARAYLDLQSIRFGDKLQVEVDVERGSEAMLPPLALQLLLENALKHNKATTESPLHIRMKRQGDMLLVENNLQKRNSEGPASGIGLNNIKERYRFFTDVPMHTDSENGRFTASLPLIAKHAR